MSTHTWHTDDTLLDAYVAGALDALEGASVEQHLLVCTECRARMAGVVDPVSLELGWDRVRTGMERPLQPVTIRLARKLGLTEPSSILLTASASLRTAWLSASFIALGFAVIATNFTDGNSVWPFLLVAPLVPVIGVAASYGPAGDPLENLIVTSPYGRQRLIMVRTLGVLVTSLPAAFGLGLLLPGPEWIAAAWLGPALAMVPILLAVAAFVGPRAAASILALAWSATVLPSARRLPMTWPVDRDHQLIYLGLAGLACLVLGARSRLTRRIGVTL